jgi:hypothetical protein
LFAGIIHTLFGLPDQTGPTKATQHRDPVWDRRDWVFCNSTDALRSGNCQGGIAEAEMLRESCQVALDVVDYWAAGGASGGEAQEAGTEGPAVHG